MQSSTLPLRVAETVTMKGAELRAGWGELLSRIPWEWMVTLTFDDRKIGSVSRRRAEREVAWWGKLLPQFYRRAVGWLCALERGRGGRWHGHSVLVGLDGKSMEPALGVWRERNGSALSRKVTDVPGVALYTSKRTADEGYIVLGEALNRYKHRLSDEPILQIYPESQSISTAQREGG